MARGDRDPALLLASGAVDCGELPDVPRAHRERAPDGDAPAGIRRGQGRVRSRYQAQASARLSARRRRGHGRLVHQRRGEDCPGIGAGVLAPQSPGRLPDLRSGGRVQAPRLLLRAPGHPEAQADGAGSQAEGCSVRPDHRLRRRAVHHVHTLHSGLRRGRKGPRPRHARAWQQE